MRLFCFATSVLVLLAASNADEGKWKELTERAVAEAQKGDIDKAIGTCEESLEIKEHFTAHQLLSQLYLALSDHDKSLHHMEKAVELEPASTALQSGVRFHRAIIAHRDGKFKDAIRLLHESEEEDHNKDVKSLERIAIAAAGLGDVTYATTLLKEIWKLAPAYVFHNSLPFVRIVDRYDALLTLAQEEGGDDGVASLREELSNVTKVTHKIFFDIDVGGGGASARLTVGLYGYAAPKATKNMVAMAKCDDKKYCYKDSQFHRIVKDFLIQGGDVSRGDGTGVTNIYDRPFADEVFALGLMHDREGVVQMANAGPDANGGQFVIMCGQAPHLNGQHVVIGKVIAGMDIVRKANAVSVDSAQRPDDKTVTITGCGVL